jgi:hypothetical protein
MKSKIFIFFALFLACSAYSQTELKQFEIVSKSSNFDVSVIEKLDLSMLDLYRAENVDNTVQIGLNGETITLKLASAVKCRQNNIIFDEGLLKKGEMMGTNPNVSKIFTFEVENNKVLNDLTTY